MKDDLTLPRNKEIEKAVLGALILSESPERVKKVREELPPDAFMAQAREIYDCLCEMADRGDSINPLMLWTRLKERNSTVEGATVAMLTDDAPIRSDLSTEIAELKKLATLRAIQYYANYLLVESQGKDTDVAALVERIKTRAGELHVEAGGQKQAISYSWADLCEMQFPPRETLLHEIERGEVVMVAAITNRGKTTFMRNAAVSLATGGEYLPLVKAGTPRVVYYLDFETGLSRARADVMKMLGRLEQSKRALMAHNFHLVADCRIDEMPLSLSNPKHLAFVEEDARRVGADVIIVDTVTVAFDFQDENNNAECTRVMKRLIRLARQLNVVVVFLHHIGKAKQEEGQTAQNVHRSRGGSALSGASTAIINLLPDPKADYVFTLECAKVKGEKFLDTVFQLDQETRWFGFQAVPATAPVSAYDQLIQVFNGQPLKRAAVLEKLEGWKPATVDRYLKEGIERGDLDKLPGGTYQKIQKPQNPIPYRDDKNGVFPQSVEDVEDNPDFDDERKNARGVFYNWPDEGLEEDSNPDEDRYLDAIDD